MTTNLYIFHFFLQKSTCSGNEKIQGFPKSDQANSPLFNLKGESWHAKKGSEKEAFFPKNTWNQIPEGLFSPTLRMGAMEQKNTFLKTRHLWFGRLGKPRVHPCPARRSQHFHWGGLNNTIDIVYMSIFKKKMYIYILIHTYFILSCIPCTLLWIPQDWKFTTWKEIHGIWHVEFHKSKRHPKKLSPHPKKGPKGWNFWQFGLDFWIGHFQKVSLPGQRRTVFAAGFVLPPFQLRMQICTTRMTIHIF